MSNTSRQLINKNSKFTFILPLIFLAFPIVFLFSQNINEKFIHVLEILFIFIIVAFFLWLLLGYVLKNRIKSSLIISFCAALFFSYGHVRFSFNNFFNISTVEFVIVTLGIYMILFVAFPIFIIKTKRALNNLVKIIAVSSIVVMMMPIVDIGEHFVYGNDYVTETYSTNTNPISVPDQSPDVYYILPDAYAGSKSTEMYWNFDNSDFKNYLTENGFYVAKDSYTNYDYTIASVPSTMNMTYVYGDGDPVDITRQSNGNLSVFDNFRSKGYTTFFIESGFYLNFLINNVDHKLCSPSDMLDTFFVRKMFDRSMILPLGVEFFLQQGDRDRVNCSFDELDKILENDKTPKFVFTHIMSPHSPFVFGPTGGSHASIFSNLDNLSRYKNNLYIDQIQFVNYKLEHIIDKLLNTDNPPIIIIQSDHGKRGATNDDEPAVRNNKQLNNFRAYYIPNGDRNIELENASPVNTFHVLFNTYFDYNYELLEDKFYILNDAETHYVDITNSMTDLNN